MGDINKTIVSSQPAFNLGFTREEGKITLSKITSDDKCKQGCFAIVDGTQKDFVSGDLSTVSSSSELVVTYTNRYEDDGKLGIGISKGAPVKAVYKGFIGVFIDQPVINHGDKVFVGTDGKIMASSSSISATAGTLSFPNVDATYTDWTAISAGDLSLKIDGAAKNLTSLDFRLVTSMDDVASVINTALSTDATCAYSATAGIVITSATTGSTSSVEFVSSTTLSTLLGTGVSVNGADAMVDTGWIVETPRKNGFIVSEIRKI